MLKQLRRLFRSDHASRGILDIASQGDALMQQASDCHQRHEVDRAIELYDTVISLQSSRAEAYYKRANLLAGRGRLDAALNDYERAIELEPAHARALCNLGLLHERRGRDDLSLASYDRALQIDAKDSLAYYNRGAVLRRLGRLEDALRSYDEAVLWNPQFAEAWVNRGNVLQELLEHAKAVESFDRALAIEPSIPQSLLGRAKSLFAQGRFDLAANAFDLAIAQSPSEEILAGLRCESRMYACAWSDFESDRDRVLRGLNERRLVCAPLLSVALFDAPSVQQAAAQVWIRDQVVDDETRSTSASRRAPRRFRPDRLHVAYFSPDFRAHPVANLTAGLFEAHDRTRFQVSAFSFGPRSTDPMAARLAQAFDLFVDARRLSDRHVAELAREKQVDIAIDLNGFTEHGRPRIFAFRAAPIQVNFLGYPGTMGADFMDYLIADRTVIPSAAQSQYAEKIAYLPGCFMPFDQRYLISEERWSRERAGLPATGTVLCCFNNHYKILPELFDQWMRILKRIPESILWLRYAGDVVMRNLRAEARLRGVAPERLVFAPHVATSASHLARLGLADLFLDTFPYNAHATAMDALWAGVPVLTRAGESFAGRVAASLLRTVGLDELIVTTPSAYEDTVVSVANDPSRCARLRQKLRLRTGPLFDTAAYVRNLEAVYEIMQKRIDAGLPPAPIESAVASQIIGEF